MTDHACDPANWQPADGTRARGIQPRKLTRHVPIRFDAEIIDRAKQAAEREGLTVSAWIRRLVARELEGHRAPGTYNDGAGNVTVTATEVRRR